MGIANIINSSNASSGGEIVRELVNSSDGAGLHFDGSAGSISGTSNLALGSKYSAEFVINYTGSANNRLFDINGDTRFIVEFNRSGFTGKIAGYDSDFYEICDIPGDGVFHLVVTVDGTAVSAYINGNLAGTATKNNSTSIDTVTQWTIGANDGGSFGHFDGTIYRARFYNRTLSADDVRTAFERSDVPVADQYGSQAELIQNGTDWTGASGTTPPSYWTVGNVATFTIDSTSGSGDEPALQIEKNGANPSMYQTQTVEVGKQYRVTYRVKNNNATNVTVRIGSTANGSEYNSLVVTSTSWNTVTRDVTATTTTLSVGVEVTTSTASQSGYIDSVSVVQTGVVQDLDLAFANPTQSRTVQDRSTNNVDGTASSSGVTQVQPVVQLNTEQLLVGGTNAKIGIGLGAGSSPQEMLHISGISPRIRLRDSDATGTPISTIDASGGDILISADANNSTSGSDIRLATDGTTRLTIDDSGATAITKTISSASANEEILAVKADYTGATNNSSFGGYLAFYHRTGGNVLQSNCNIGVVGQSGNSSDLVFRTSTGTSPTPLTRLTLDGTNGLATFTGGITVSGGVTTLGSFSELTIASGAITVTSSVHAVDTEGDAASDDLDTINGGSNGSMLTLRSVTGARDVTLKDSTDNLRLAGDFTLTSANDSITLIKYGSTWIETSRSNNN